MSTEFVLETIHVGSIPNDGTGDDLRTALYKTNYNFQQLDHKFAVPTTASSLGSGTALLVNHDHPLLEFRSVHANNGITLDVTDHEIHLGTNPNLRSFVVSTNSGSVIIQTQQQLHITGHGLITTSVSNNSLNIHSAALESVDEDLWPTLGGNLDAAGHSVHAVQSVEAQEVHSDFNGNLVGLVHSVDIRTLTAERQRANSWNFGVISMVTVSTRYEWVFYTFGVDFGSIASSQPELEFDAGPLASF